MNLDKDRKYKAFWAMFLMATVVLVFDKITGAQWVESTMWIFGLFMGGNVGEHFSKRKDDVSND